MPYFTPINPAKQLGEAVVCLLLTVVAFAIACRLTSLGQWAWASVAFGISFFLAMATYGGFSIWNQATSPNKRG